ncbi:di-trans,poly-cis-decaprenylcistransferase [Aeromicrobium sp.]|nr:di-trans,poly-cis-decaprenylcistransferase [Candidatus Saccharibacteria bacterium]
MDQADTVPKHVGVIMDGNRRWAKEHGLAASKGHAAGQKALYGLMHHAFSCGVQYLTVYAFSSENFKRSPDEVGYIMRQVTVALGKYLKELVDGGVKVVFLGSREGLKSSVLKAFDMIEAATANNTKGTFAICFNYGGEQELTDAVRSIVRDGITEAEITPEVVANHLYGPEVPPIDLVIRTGGDQRISNFMLWRIAYSELMFTPTYWPDFSNDEFDTMLTAYAERQRRFGK